jgi:tetratricopeptide (TPR) repeat protein
MAKNRIINGSQVKNSVGTPKSTIQVPALFSEAITLHRNGLLAQAKARYQQIIQLQPKHFDALHALGVMALQAGDYAQAVELFSRAIKINPKIAEAHNNLGNALRELRRHDAALQCYERAITLKPNFADPFYNRGQLYKERQDFVRALANYQKVIALKPDFLLAHINLGNILQKLQRFDEAIASYDQVISLKADFAEAYVNKGVALSKLNRFPEALSCHEYAIALQPNYAEALLNRGFALFQLKQFAAAQESYDQAIALNPDYAEAYWNKALLKLLLGEFAEGWALYEWRWKNPQHSSPDRQFSQPVWHGTVPLTGKTLLLHSEQGFGDAIQFCRYVLQLSAVQAKVIIETPKPLMALFSSLPADVHVVEKGQPLPAFDLHCPLLTLPMACKTTLASIPAPAAYLYADQQKQLLWQQKLGKKRGLRIGLVWSGSAGHQNDHNRSIPLTAFAPLLDLALEWHALQVEIRADDVKFLATFSQLHSHQESLNDFSDTAALIAEMDLVIAVDTSVAHLAGALGKPVWILLPYLPDFRWLLDRNDSPWYPTATLFRQTEPGNWYTVISAVSQRISRMCS